LKKNINLQKKLPPVTCKAENTLGEVLQKIVDYKVHRIFVVNEDNQPTNVLTLTTFMKLLSPKGSECFV